MVRPLSVSLPRWLGEKVEFRDVLRMRRLCQSLVLRLLWTLAVCGVGLAGVCPWLLCRRAWFLRPGLTCGASCGRHQGGQKALLHFSQPVAVVGLQVEWCVHRQLLCVVGYVFGSLSPLRPCCPNAGSLFGRDGRWRMRGCWSCIVDCHLGCISFVGEGGLWCGCIGLACFLFASKQ
jgi:hypothetical protein